jgi:hypothetical protein
MMLKSAELTLLKFRPDWQFGPKCENSVASNGCADSRPVSMDKWTTRCGNALDMGFSY